MTPDELIDALLIWRGTYRDMDNDYDARLLNHAAETIKSQWDRIGELEDALNKETPAV